MDEPLAVDVPELVPARMVNEFAYCPRLFFLEWVDRRLTDNTDTVDGRYQHRRVDQAGGRVPEPMLGDDRSLPGKPFAFEGRNRRPPTDPVNCLLSFVYTLLVKDLVATCVGVGLDPYIGVFHRPRFGRPALALDLAEEFRPLIADSVVVNLINNGEVKGSDFTMRAGGVSLTDDGRKAVLSAYERRIEVEVTHPVFGYTITYRRVLEVQARLLASYLLGELPRYTPFTTR